MRFTITEIPDNDAHKRRNNKARSEWRKANPVKSRYHNVPTRFVGVDGEGVTLPDGTHRYVLLGVGNKHISNPNGLEFTECMEFLWSQFRTGSVAYVGFFLGYDFVQWFRSLPENRARILLTDEGRAKRKPRTDKRPMPFPVEYKGWEFDILGTKRFKVRKAGSSRWMNICDTGPFFQKSFLKVIDPREWSDPVVSDSEYRTITRGKQARSTAKLDSAMVQYNALENEILSRVMCRLNEGFQKLGIHLSPGQWFGPGQAAQAWLDTRAITTESLQTITPSGALESARQSYFGGWFEIMAHGIIPGTTYEYDINSAYPYIISTLPCLEHGTWTHDIPARNAALTQEEAKSTRRNTTHGHQSYTLVYAKVRGRNNYIGAMLHRDRDGNVLRPRETEGWYWSHELDAAKRAKLIYGAPDILDRWTYVPCDCPPPLREVRDIYELRKQVGKKTPLGIACKLVPNSLYGKFAQSVGNPKFGNPVYASLITAGCRTMILDAIATHPKGYKDVLMVATDGIYFRTPHPSLPVSGDLGDWDAEEKQNICLFKPGVYWDDKTRANIARGESPVFKSRGVSARDFGSQIAEIDRQFQQHAVGGTVAGSTRSWWPEVQFPLSFAMVSAVQALQRGNWALAGTVIPDPVNRQSSRPFGKRGPGGYEDGIYRTQPHRYGTGFDDEYEPSHPYEKRFGMDDPFSDEYGEANGLTADGLPGMLVREALGM